MDLETIVTIVVVAGFAAFLFFKMKNKSSDNTGSGAGGGTNPGKDDGGRQQLK